jgi:hypothetical protein
MRGAELVERAALHHRKIAAGFAMCQTPVGAAGQRHVGRIAVEIETVDRPAHHLFFPVIVEIGQQRRARSAHRRMNVAVDPRGRHGRSSDIALLAARGAAFERVPPIAGKRKGFGLRWKHCRAARSVYKRTKIRGNDRDG